VVAVLLALGSSASYGTADFLGGLASRRAAATAVVLVSQSVGLATLAAVLALTDRQLPAAVDLGWGGLAGLCGMVGLVLFYRGLAAGTMSVVAPVTAVVSAIVPVVAGLALGERPGWLAMTGIALAVPAIVLLGWGGSPPGTGRHVDRRALVLAAAAGVGFGLFFVTLSRASSDAGLWPVLAARVASVTALAVLITLQRAWGGVPAAVSSLSAGAGVLDTTANGLYLLAVQRGLLSEVAVLSSLYPASTIVLASTVLHERLARLQWWGLALAGVAVVAIAA
jgi:drug/metabolite transporter (DMT)-like permease